MLAVLRNPTYAKLFSAQIIALLGTGLLTVALGLLAFEIAGGDAGITLRFAMNPMFLDEALLQMKTQRHLFFVFMNADTERVNLLCRPAEGEIGHLVPKKLQGPGRPALFRMRVYAEEAVAADRRPRAVRREDRLVGWESPEEAVEAMAAAGERYRFFMNTEARTPCVVYAQAGGGHGLIEPGG